MLGFMLAGMDLRPTIARLIDEHQLNPDVLAIFADVPKKTIQEMLSGSPVHKAEAKKVLCELSWLLQKELSFEDVYIPLEEHE